LGSLPTETGLPRKTQERQRVQSGFSGGRESLPQRKRHGAVHDKTDDKLNLIKYDYDTRKFGGFQA
jgi:hypothetical protein